MRNKNLIYKLTKILKEVDYNQDSDLEQDPKFQEFKNTLRNIKNLQQLDETTSDLLYSLNMPPIHKPKILETLLNYGVGTKHSLKIPNLINGSYSSQGRFFGYNNTYYEENIGYDLAQTLIVSIARVILQNPDLLEKQTYGSTGKNSLHIVINVISEILSPQNGWFVRDGLDAEMENCKKYLSLLFTLIILINPKLLEQKRYARVNTYQDLERKTPIELFSAYLLSYNVDHPHMKELYDNFQQVIEFTQDNHHILSQKIRELINYINSIKPNSKIDSSKLKSIVSEIKDKTQTQTSRNNPAEKCFVDVGNLLIKNLPTILLDRHISNLRSPDYQDALKRELLIRYYRRNKYKIGEDQEKLRGFTDIYELILHNLNLKDLNNLIKAVFGDLSEEIDKKVSYILEKEVFKTIELLNEKSIDINNVINHIESSSAQGLIKKDEEYFNSSEDFLEFSALIDIRALFENYDEQDQEKLKNEKEADLAPVSSSLKKEEKAPLKEKNQAYLAPVSSSLTKEEKALKEKNQNELQIKKYVVISLALLGIGLVSFIAGIIFEAYLTVLFVEVFVITISIYCIDRYYNSKVDTELTAPQVEGTMNNKLAA